MSLGLNKTQHAKSAHFSGSALFAFFIATLLAIPVITIALFALSPSTEIWQHLKDTVLSEYLINSLVLAISVGVASVLIGTSTAWLTTLYQFPGQRLLPWLLLLPLAMPAYIIAFTYSGLLDSVGSVQSQLRSITGWQYGDYWFPEIHSLGGAISMLTLVLYPYVFLLARASFLEQSICALDVGRTLGLSPWQRFRRIALPMARPSIVAGASLVIMETLADYGTVQYFGISTFTTGIFRTWFGLGDAAAAANLSAILLLFVFAFLGIEKYSRRQRGYQSTSQRHQRIQPQVLTGYKAWLTSALCFAPFVFGFAIPALQLSSWAIDASAQIDRDFLMLCWNSFWLAAVTATLAVSLAAILIFQQRRAQLLRKPSAKLSAFSLRIAGMGYATPGTVIAVGVMIPAGLLDNGLNNIFEHLTGQRYGLLLSGSFALLIFAYLVRFMAVSLQSVEAGFSKIKISLDDAARSLGLNSWQTLQKIHLPMLKSTLLTALLIVFVDVLKELPATLVMRPFNFNTLAVRAFELASDERLSDAALPAIAIILTGLIPVLLLSRSIAHRVEKNA